MPLLIHENPGGLKVWRLGCYRCGCFLIRWNGKNILVDNSVIRERQRLLRELAKLEVEGLDALLLTHSHTDHVENTTFLQQSYGCSVLIHERGIPYMRQGSCILPEGTRPTSRLIAKAANSGLFSWVRFPPGERLVALDQAALDAILENGAERHGVRVAHMPGHSADSCGLFLDDGAAIVGDAMVHSLTGRIYPPYADDTEALAQTFRTFRDSGCATFYPAHGKGISRQIFMREIGNHLS